MRNNICLLLVCLPFFVSSQTAYYDALYLAERYPVYQRFITQVERYRDSLEANAAIENSTFLFGSKKEEAYFQFAKQFLDKPLHSYSPLAVEENFAIGSGIVFDEYNSISALEIWDQWVTTGIGPSWQIVYPFLEDATNTIFSRDHTPLFTFQPADTIFYHYETDVPVELYVQPNKAPFEPTPDHQLIAIYNPITGGFHKRQGDFFSKQPTAYFNPLENNIEGPLRQLGYAIDNTSISEPEIFITEKDILLIFVNKGSSLVEVVLLGENKPEEDFLINESMSDDSRGIPMTSASSAFELVQETALSAPTFPSMAIDAMAQFLVDRTKDELILAFFERFLEKMDQSPELRTLFPNSYFLLQSQDLFRLPSMGPLWVETFQSDLFHLLPNTNKLLLTDPTYATLIDQPKVKAFRLTHQLLKLYEEELSPLEVLEQIQYEYGNATDPISRNVELLYGLSKELKAKNEQGIHAGAMLTPTALRKMDHLTQKYFIALIYFKNREILVKEIEEESLYRLSLIESPRPFLQNIINLSTLLWNIQQKSLVYRNSLLAGDSVVNDNNHFFNLSQTIHQLLEYGFKLQFLTDPSAYFQSEEYQSYFSMIRNTIQATEDIHREELGLFLIHYLQLLEPLLDEKLQLKKEPATQQASRLVKDLFFYASFMVDIVSARNSQQINGILQQYALPVGSYRLKRRSQFSLEVNAYPGLYVGVEEGLNNSLKADNVLGITAPIGFSLSWGESQNKKGRSFGVFLPLIDIGAAFSYRWNGTATGFPEQLRWRQVLSPGLHGVWGFRQLPISLMAGMQVTPQLRKIKPQDIASLDGNVWRYGVSLVVDIPMFNLYLRE